MDIYSRGHWGKDDEYSDDDIYLDNNQLQYKNFEGCPELVIGEEFMMQVRIYASNNLQDKYLFFAVIDTGNRSFWYLVDDFPSVLMLIKEVLPIIREGREQEAHEVLMEEHAWKTQQLEPYQYRKQCAH